MQSIGFEESTGGRVTASRLLLVKLVVGDNPNPGLSGFVGSKIGVYNALESPVSSRLNSVQCI